MATDPRNLRPVEVVRLMNMTPLGEVLNDRQLYRHRQRAGYRIGRDRTIDLFRYVGWLYAQRHGDLRLVGSSDYDALREQSRSRNVTLSLSGRDIAPLPEVADPERRAAALASFQVFCETYFAAAFTLAWSPDHLKAMAKIERAVLEGELFAHAMPRGSGKTTLACVACIWAAFTGERRFVCLIAASADRAKALLSTIKTFLEVSELLAQDFPEVIYPVHKLGRIVNRQSGQLFEGQPTRIEWSVDRIVLPTIPGSAAGGTVISTSGMKGSDIRGQHHVLADGAIIRPDLTVIDDPQTTESARSRSQCQEREAIVAGDILGMAGPGKKIAGIMCCTVIRPNDMADRILNRELHPEWYGERTKLIYKFPSNEELWAKYAVIRRDSLRNGGDGRTATDFYRKNQAKMDTGAEVAWPERFDTNFYKSFVHARLAVALADPSSLSLFGTSSEQHRMFAEQLTAEYRVPTEGRGRKVDEWKQRPGQDNHFFDCLVGCAVAASMQGAALENIAVPYKLRKRVSLAEMQQEAFRRQGLR
ncbi:MAG: terminase gpA endonuclease subunit [Pirellulales bacterium]